MTVFVYVNTSKQVGDPEQIKSSPPRMQRQPGSRKTIPKALPLSTRFWNEPDRPQDRSCAMSVILVLAIVSQVLGSL
jgi:hypothetical protein